MSGKAASAKTVADSDVGEWVGAPRGPPGEMSQRGDAPKADPQRGPQNSTQQQRCWGSCKEKGRGGFRFLSRKWKGKWKDGGAEEAGWLVPAHATHWRCRPGGSPKPRHPTPSWHWWAAMVPLTPAMSPELGPRLLPASCHGPGLRPREPRPLARRPAPTLCAATQSSATEATPPSQESRPSTEIPL